mgnify:CR=1 FL=1
MAVLRQVAFVREHGMMGVAVLFIRIKALYVPDAGN